MLVVEKNGDEIDFICSGTLRLQQTELGTFWNAISFKASNYRASRGPKGPPMGEWAFVAWSYSKAFQTYLRHRKAVGPRDTFFIPTQRLLHYLVLLYLPTVPYLPLTPNNCF